MKAYVSLEEVLSVFDDIHPLDYNANAYLEQIKKIPIKRFEEYSRINAPLNNVVFCLECKHRGYKDFNCYCESGPMTGIIYPWDYCSRGELRDEFKKVVDK